MRKVPAALPCPASPVRAVLLAARHRLLCLCPELQALAWALSWDASGAANWLCDKITQSPVFRTLIQQRAGQIGSCFLLGRESPKSSPWCWAAWSGFTLLSVADTLHLGAEYSSQGFVPTWDFCLQMEGDSSWSYVSIFIIFLVAVWHHWYAHVH